MIRLEKQFQQNPSDDIEEDTKLCGLNAIGKNTWRNLLNLF